jgi:phage-related protein
VSAVAGKSNIVRIAFVADGIARVRSALGSAGSAAEESARKFSSAGRAVTAAFAVMSGSAVAFGKSSLSAFNDAAAATRNVQRQFGGTAEQASQLAAATKLAGLSDETWAMGLKTLAKQLSATSTSTKTVTDRVKVWDGTWRKQSSTVQDAAGKFHTYTTMVKNFTTKSVQRQVSQVSPLIKTLGFDVRDSAGHVKSLYDVLPQLADKFRSMPAGAERTALALKLFGRAGQQMLPFLVKGSAGIADLEKRADDLGLTLSGKDLDAQLAYIKAQREWSASVQGIKISIGRVLLPVMTQLTNSWLAQLPAIRSWVRSALPGIKVAAKLAADKLRELAAFALSVLTFLGRYKSVAIPAANALLAVAVAVKAVTVATKAWGAASSFLSPWTVALVLLVAGFTIAYKRSATFRNLVQRSVQTVQQAVTRMSRAAAPLLSRLWTEAVRVAKAAWPYLVSGWSKLSGAVMAVVRFVGPVLATMWRGIVAGAEWVWPYLVSGWSKLSGAVMAVVRFVGPVLATMWAGIKAGASGLQTAFSAVSRVVTAVLGPPLRAFWAFTRGAVAILTPILKLMWVGFSTAVRVAVAVVGGVLSVLWAGIKAGAAIVGAVLGPVFNGLVAGVQLAYRLVAPVVTMLFNGMLAWVHALSAAWSGMWSGISSIVTVTMGAVASVVRAVCSFMGAGFKRAGDAIISAWSAVTGGMAAVAAGIAKVFTDAWGTVTGKFSDAAQWFKGIGGQIVQGLVDGLTGAWHFVTDKLSELTSALPGPVRKLLRIESPSKVFAGIGANIGQGLSAGILATRGLVSSGLSQLVALPANVQVKASVAASSPLTAAQGTRAAREVTVAVIQGKPQTSEAQGIIRALQEHCKVNGPISGVRVRPA